MANIKASSFNAISVTSAFNHFLGETGQSLSPHISSIFMPATPLDFAAVQNAINLVKGTGNLASIPTQIGNAGLAGVSSEINFNDKYTYGNLEIQFSGTATGLPSGGALISGGLSSPTPELYDGNVSFWNFVSGEGRSVAAEIYTAFLGALDLGGIAEEFAISIQGSLEYALEIDSSGNVVESTSSISTVVAGSVLTLKLDEILPGESFAEAYLRKNSSQGPGSEYEKFVDAQTVDAEDFFAEFSEGIYDSFGEFVLRAYEAGAAGVEEVRDFIVSISIKFIKGEVEQSVKDLVDDLIEQIDALRLPRCFPAQTPVTLADGSSKPIADILIGDEVLSFKPDGSLVAGTVGPAMTPLCSFRMALTG